jgi:hypothetical protein
MRLSWPHGELVAVRRAHREAMGNIVFQRPASALIPKTVMDNKGLTVAQSTVEKGIGQHKAVTIMRQRAGTMTREENFSEELSFESARRFTGRDGR